MFSGIEILQKGSEWKRVISNSYAKYVRYNLIQHTWVFKATSCLLDQWKWKPKADHLYGLFELLFVLPCLFPLSCYVYIWIRLLTSVHNKCERCVLRDMYLLNKKNNNFCIKFASVKCQCPSTIYTAYFCVLKEFEN